MKKIDTLRLCELALLVAVEILMSLTPLGFLNLGFLSASLLSIPVAIGAILLGPLESTLLGAIFGLCSFFKGFSSPSLLQIAMYSTSIPGVFVVSFGGRVLMGLCTGLVVRAIRRIRGKEGLLDCVAGSLAAPLLNTAFFMGLLMLIFYHSEYITNLVRETGISNPFLLIGFMVGIQAIIEAVTCGIISTAVSKAIHAAVRKRR